MEVEVLVEGRGDELTVKLADQSTMRIPRAWTDADGTVRASAPQAPTVFTVHSVRELLDLVEALHRRTESTAEGVANRPSLKYRDGGRS
jgi:hypothetical protein